MFLLIAAGFALAALVHGAAVRASRTKRVELVLVYLVAGYLGVVMAAVALFVLFAPERAAGMLGAEPGNPFQQFLGINYLALAVVAILAAFLRGRYLVAPVVGWSVFFFAATAVHVSQFAAAGSLDVHAVGHIVLEHAVVPVAVIALALWLRALSR